MWAPMIFDLVKDFADVLDVIQEHTSEGLPRRARLVGGGFTSLLKEGDSRAHALDTSSFPEPD